MKDAKDITQIIFRVAVTAGVLSRHPVSTRDREMRFHGTGNSDTMVIN
jgi:hypothetical protein